MGSPAPGLLGRSSEREMIDRLLDDAHAGRSSVLVVRGEAGIGKTALLGYAAGRASRFDVVRVTGVEAEMELPFAGIQQLCADMLGAAAALPTPQEQALRVALGLTAGERPDRFLIGLAVLGLLATKAEERPLLCLVEDAQWLDSASMQVLGFVARRLLAESVAIVVAVREPAEVSDLDGVSEVRLEGLDEADARALLTSAVAGRLDDRIRDRIVAETRGNPLALLELPRGMSAAQLAGGFDLPVLADAPEQIERQYASRAQSLPEATRILLLLAAAEPAGDAALVWRAAQTFGIDAPALAAARAVDLLEIGADVRFRHPLVRSAMYRAASRSDRRRAHGALADATDPEEEPDRRAWHRALAADGVDDDVAAELERSAGRAQTRGGLAAAAALLERAAALTGDPRQRADRELAAAHAHHQAGAPEPAVALLARARAGPPDDLRHAHAELLRAQIAFTSRHGGDAPALLLDAARRLEPLDATLARETYLEALMAAQLAGRLDPTAAATVAEAARAAPRSPAPRAPDVLLDAVAVMLTEGHDAAAPLLKAAVVRFRDDESAATDALRWFWPAEEAAIEVWDHDSWHDLAARELRLVRQAGALTILPLALTANAVAETFAGRLAAAASLIDEINVAAEATARPLAPYGGLSLAAWRGREAEVDALTKATLDHAERVGDGLAMSTAQWANALLHNSLGQYELAAAAAQQLLDAPGRLDATVAWGMPELVEAAVRTGDADLAQDALERLAATTRAAGTDWGLGLEARSRALTSCGEDTERLYREAVARLGRTRVRGEHARAHLLYGEWLRREGRRVDAREQLRAAHRLFTEMGMEAFAERAGHEVLATGATVRRRTAETRDELTAQEGQIARLASDGLTNPEIAGRLFLSPRTVEWHLRKVYAKLNVRNRAELARVLPSRQPDVLAAGSTHD